MGDVADILGGARRPQLSEGEALLMDGGLKTGGGGGAGANKGKRKPAGMSREVFNLIGKEGMAPAVVSKKAVGLKDKREGTARTRWVFTTFRNSARKDQEKLDQAQQGQGGGVGEEEAKEGGASGATAAAAGQVFYHWVKAATDYPDYPFARFNVQTPPVEFTEEEYKSYLAAGDAAAAAAAAATGGATAAAWGKEETKVLLELCNRFDLRWPVIYDRFPEAVADATAAAAAAAKEGGKKGGAAGATAEATKPRSPQQSIEDLQARFYSVRKTLRLARQAAAAAAAAQGGVAPPQVMFQPGLDEDGDTFDHPYEKTRRAQLARLFRRSKEEELEVSREGEAGREGGRVCVVCVCVLGLITLMRRRGGPSWRVVQEELRGGVGVRRMWFCFCFSPFVIEFVVEVRNHPSLPPSLPPFLLTHRNSASGKSSKQSTPPSNVCENTPSSPSCGTPARPKPRPSPSPTLNSNNQGKHAPSPWSTKNTYPKLAPSRNQVILTCKVLVCRFRLHLLVYRRGCSKR